MAEENIRLIMTNSGGWKKKNPPHWRDFVRALGRIGPVLLRLSLADVMA
jgi:hypothetical protein